MSHKPQTSTTTVFEQKGEIYTGKATESVKTFVDYASGKEKTLKVHHVTVTRKGTHVGDRFVNSKSSAKKAAESAAKRRNRFGWDK